MKRDRRKWKIPTSFQRMIIWRRISFVLRATRSHHNQTRHIFGTNRIIRTQSIIERQSVWNSYSHGDRSPFSSRQSKWHLSAIYICLNLSFLSNASFPLFSSILLMWYLASIVMIVVGLGTAISLRFIDAPYGKFAPDKPSREEECNN